MVSTARTTRKQPAWIGNTLWTAMVTYWDTEAAKTKSESCSSSRMSTRGGIGVAKHVGGSKAFLQHHHDMEEELGRPVSISEVFMKTHTRSDGSFVDLKAKQIVETFEKSREDRLSQVDPSLASDGRTEVPLSQAEEDELFVQAYVSLRQGRYYGLGDIRTRNDAGGHLAGGSSRPALSAMAEELRKSQDMIADQQRVISDIRRELDAKREEDQMIWRFLQEDPRFQQFVGSRRPPSTEDPSTGSTPPQA